MMQQRDECCSGARRLPERPWRAARAEGNASPFEDGLRDVGVPSTLIVYAGFGHGINKPKSNRAVLQHNYDWFSHYVFGEEIPKDSPLRGSSAIVDHSGE